MPGGNSSLICLEKIHARSEEEDDLLTKSNKKVRVRDARSEQPLTDEEMTPMKHEYDNLVECPCVGQVDTRTRAGYVSDTPRGVSLTK